MKRHLPLALAATAAMLALAALAAPRQQQSLLVLEWAAQSDAPKPPAAVLIEMGVQDAQPRPWNGRAAVRGARVVHREGYRFRKDDELTEPDGWKAASHRGLRAPKGQGKLTAKLEPNASVGVVLHLAGVQEGATLTVEAGEKAVVPLKQVLAGHAHKLWNGTAVVRLISTASPVAVGKTEDDFPAAAHGPDGTLWVAYISYTVRDEGRRIEQKPLVKQPENFKALYTPEFGDQLFVKSFRGGKWGAPIAVTGPNQDLVRCAVAAEKGGRVWVAYSAHRDGAFNIFVRGLTPSAGRPGEVSLASEQQVTYGKNPNLSPVLATDGQGRVVMAFQSWNSNGFAGIKLLQLTANAEDLKKAKFASLTVGDARGNCWHPSLAYGPGGRAALVFDTYYGGDYDIFLNSWSERDVGKMVGKSVLMRATGSPRFETRPTAVYDKQGRLWVAYEEGPENWGKDYGALESERGGNPLYNRRSVKVLCFDKEGDWQPAAELPASTTETPRLPYDALKTARFEREPRYAHPRIGIDGRGSVWLTYRRNFGTRYSSHPGAYWLTFARRLDGDHWSEEIEVHHSDGLLDSRPAVLPHKSGGLLIVHNADGRYTEPQTVHNHIFASVIDLPGGPVEPKLVRAKAPPGKKDAEAAKSEADAARRMRDYRVEAGGKQYHLLRGEFHRHTEISWDGSGDGSLEDMFRYALDAAAMDWIGNGDHDNGAGREYSWWLIQKFSDAYNVPGHFTPMFTYERSVAYPHGHRNCMFAKRGVRTLPRLAPPEGQKAPAGVHPDDTKMLYRYLRELGGVCASHTSATGMGTDWRDNDPVVEPVVEIYQGDRMSYEQEGAPRAGYDPKGNRLPANVAGWFPKGFVNHALQKGYRLGFQSSSDHWSTHISFFVVLAEKRDRDSILDAVKKRHCYGATDFIVVDLRSGKHVMGDEFESDAAPALQMTVIGTGKLAKIDVLKDSDVVETIRPKGKEYRGTWTDPRPAAGTHYYYIRVLQEDEQIAWASPLWVRSKR